MEAKGLGAGQVRGSAEGDRSAARRALAGTHQKPLSVALPSLVVCLSVFVCLLFSCLTLVSHMLCITIIPSLALYMSWRCVLRSFVYVQSFNLRVLFISFHFSLDCPQPSCASQPCGIAGVKANYGLEKTCREIMTRTSPAPRRSQLARSSSPRRSTSSSGGCWGWSTASHRSLQGDSSAQNRTKVLTRTEPWWRAGSRRTRHSAGCSSGKATTSSSWST